MTLFLLPIWLIDFIGSFLFILFAGLCLRQTFAILKADKESPLAIFLLWFSGALFALAVSRSMGHIVNHLLFLLGREDLWNTVGPYSGSINTITFVVIASVTLFFERIESIMDRMMRDRDKIEKNSQELLRLNKDIEAVIAERTRAEMALRIAHEVRNPATIIGGMVSRLLNSPTATPGDKSKLTHILEQSRKLEGLVSRFESIRPESKKIFAPLDLNPVVEEAMAIVQQDARAKDIALVFDRCHSSLIFQGNGSLLKMAFTHLMRNAIAASPAGNMIHIITDLAPNGMLLLIRDNGPGIPKDVLEHIFEPQFRIRRQTPGLGLPYVKQIITEHMGKIKINSSPGNGTTVKILLPSHLGELGRGASAEYMI